jgi:hypothetical protein
MKKGLFVLVMLHLAFTHIGNLDCFIMIPLC